MWCWVRQMINEVVMKSIKPYKKLIITIVCVVLVIVGIVLFIPKKGSFFYGSDVPEIKSITITSGTTGDIIYLDKEHYEEFMKDMNDVTYYPNYLASTSYGWAYNVVIKTEDKTTGIFLLGEACEINNVKYRYKSDSEEGIIQMIQRLSGI